MPVTTSEQQRIAAENARKGSEKPEPVKEQPAPEPMAGSKETLQKPAVSEATGASPSHPVLPPLNLNENKITKVS